MDLRDKVLEEIDGLMDNAASDCRTNRCVAADAILSLIDEERRALVKQNYDLAVLSDANLKAAEARCSKLEDALDGLLDGLDSNHDPERLGLLDGEWEKRISYARAALAAAGEGQWWSLSIPKIADALLAALKGDE